MLSEVLSITKTDCGQQHVSSAVKAKVPEIIKATPMTMEMWPKTAIGAAYVMMAHMAMPVRQLTPRPYFKMREDSDAVRFDGVGR